MNTSMLDCGCHYGWEALIGGWDTDNAGNEWYEIPTITTYMMPYDCASNVLIIKLQTEAATIFQGDYLALKITNKDCVTHTVNTDGRSSLRSPDSDPQYPLPELPTVILLGVGFVGLLGYYGLKQARAWTKV